jgi:hypothetical protein
MSAINHPAHYGGDTTYEAIKVIEAWDLGFHLGNTVKYISRAGKKGDGDPVEDLEKARWYLDRAIARAMKRRGEIGTFLGIQFIKTKKPRKKKMASRSRSGIRHKTA